MAPAIGFGASSAHWFLAKVKMPLMLNSMTSYRPRWQGIWPRRMRLNGYQAEETMREVATADVKVKLHGCSARLSTANQTFVDLTQPQPADLWPHSPLTVIVAFLIVTAEFAGSSSVVPAYFSVTYY